MSEWKETELKNCFDLNNGYAFKSNNFIDYQDEGTLPVIKIKNVANGDVNIDSVVYHKYNDELSRYKIKKGDVLIAMTGNHPQANTQIVGLVSKYKLDIDALLNQRVGKFIIKKDNSLEYFYYFFKNEEIHMYLANNSSGSANQANISKSDIVGIVARIPKIGEQKAIASVLSSLDDKIDLLRRQNATLEKMAEAIFRQWFIEEAKEEWELTRLKEVVDISIGRTPPRKESQWFSYNPEDMKWISIKDMGKPSVYILDSSEYLTREAVEQFNIPVIPDNTVILSFKMTVGRVAITVGKMLSNEAIAHFHIKGETPLTTVYLYFIVKNYKYDSLGSTSSIVTSINSAMLKELEITIPRSQIMNQFSKIVTPMFLKIRHNQNQISTLTTIRDNLLPKLMSGEVRIKT